MTVHRAVWHFAETRGTKRAKAYVAKRNKPKGVTKSKRDTAWLTGRGGARMRNAWFALPIQEREQLMGMYPDPSFPQGTDGVLDERKRVQELRSTDPDALVRSGTSAATLAANDTDKQRHLTALAKSKSRYLDVKCEEENLRLNTAYNRGNMAGVVEALVEGVQSAILLAHSRDQPRSSQDAFRAVCTRVSDVLAGAMSTAEMPPEPDYTSDAPSEEFAKSRIMQAKAQYDSALASAVQYLASKGDYEDPDPSILNPNKRYFGKQN